MKELDKCPINFLLFVFLVVGGQEEKWDGSENNVPSSASA